MSAAAETEAAATGPSGGPTLRRTSRGAMKYGGTVSFTVEASGHWIGWVGDERPRRGGREGGRRWWACWREDGDAHARWNGQGYLTRQSAVDALVAAAGAS